MINNTLIIKLIKQIQDELNYMKMAGIDTINCSKSSLSIINKWDIENNFKQKDYINLKKLNKDIRDCKLCDLSIHRKNIVFGEGNPNTNLVFIGEGPGSEEDKTGRPFIGRAGKLLTRIIEAMDLTRSQVYICNIVKCRPPGNRNPSSFEISKCMPFLKKQIKAVNPKVICLLGAVASQSFLNVKTPISRLRGKFITLPKMKDIKIMPTYHPAYLLRNPEQKKYVWEDIKKIMQIIK